MFRSILVSTLAVCVLAGCSEGIVADRGSPAMRATPPVATTTSSFSEAGGIVIPSEQPDAEAVAFASRCGGERAAAVRTGISECELIGLKGTPSRVISGLDQNGVAHNAIWYVEAGQRVVYKFDNDRLVQIIR